MSGIAALLARRSPSLIGLDIGSSAIKAVELEATRKGYRVAAAGSAPLEEGAIVDGVIVDGDAVAEAIRAACASRRFRARTVAAAVGGGSALIRRIRVPRMSDSELDESVHWEFDQHVPFDVEEVALDYRVLDTAPDEERRDTMDVLLVAAKKDRIVERTRVIERAGLAAAVIDIDALALCNAYESSHGARPATVMLVHAGASKVTIAIARGGGLESARDAVLAHPLQGDFAVQSDFAEELGTRRVPPGGIDGHDAPEVDGAAMAELVALEMQRAVEGGGDADASMSLERVVVSGGWSCAPGFTDTLARAVQVPVARFEPFRGLEVAPGVAGCDLLAGAAPAAAIAVGLARRRGDDR